MRTLLVALVMIATTFVAVPALACSCITPSPEQEKKRAELVFVGRVTGIQTERSTWPPVKVSFEVLQAWRRRAPETVTVGTALDGAACGYIPVEGGTYLIFAHRREGSGLMIDLCSNNAPIPCAEEALGRFGRPATRHHPLPAMKDVGSDENPNTWWITCASRPVRVEGSLELPRGVHMSRFSATILRDGSVRDLAFELECAEHATEPCTDELRDRVQAAIEGWKYQPAMLHGRAVAMTVSYESGDRR